MPDVINPDAQTSVERDGRVLSGMGVSEDRLHAVMDRDATPEAPAETPLGNAGTPAPAPATAEAAATPAPVDEKPSRGRQRFSDLTREREEARAETARLRTEFETATRERDELRARLAAPPAAVAQPQPPAAPAQPQYTRPEPTEDDIGTKYATYPEFTRDQARWVLEQEQQSFDARIEQRIYAAQQQQRFQQTALQAQERGRKAYADFDQQLAKGPGSQVPLGRFPQEAVERAQFVISHPHSEHLQYAILRDGALAARLQQMDPYSFGLALAALVPTQGSGASPASPALPVATPPAPFQPVGSGSTTTTPSSADLAKRGSFDFDKSGYREKRAAERGVARRR